MDSLAYHHSGGRRPKLTSRQKKRLVELLEAGPQVVGCETACWTSVLIRVLIGREFGVLDNCQYVCTLLHNLGCSFQKARFVSDHLDGSCTSPLRIIPSAQKPGTMPHLTTLWRGQCHGLASFLLPTRFVGDPLALRHVACHWVQARPARPTRAGQAQAQACSRARSIRGPDAPACLCVVSTSNRGDPSTASYPARSPAAHEPPPPDGGYV